MNQPPLRQRSGFHISLKWLLLSVVPVSFGAAALESATTAWAVAAVTVTLLAMFGTIVAAKFDARRRRPIWLGFAVFAGGYLVVLFAAPRDIVEAMGTEKLNRLLQERCHPGVDYPVEQIILLRTPPADERRSRGADSAIIIALYGWLGDPPAASDSADSTAAEVDTHADTGHPTNTFVPVNDVAPNAPTADSFAEESRKHAVAENFKEIARCAWAWFFGICGACLANCLAIRNATASADVGSTPAEMADKRATPSRSRARIVGTAILIVGVVFADGFVIWRANSTRCLIVVSAVAVGSLGAAISTLFGDPRRRAFRGGFAICCGGYFLFCAFADGGNEDGIGVHSFFQSSVMAKSLRWVWDSGIPTQDIPIHIPIQGTDQSGPGMLGVPMGATSSENTDSDAGFADHAAARSTNAELQVLRWPNYLQTGYCLWALALGWMGGGLAQFLARRRSESRTKRSSATKHETTGVSNVFA
jgi:hypothetical protein